MQTGRITSVASVALILALIAMVAPASAEQVVFARHLALSPDGQKLAFSWAGDIWAVSAIGGPARRLTINSAYESNPVWSHDGGFLAFASNRHGAQNVFVMTAHGNEIRRLTFSDNAEIPTDFSPDGKYVYYHSRKTGEQNWNARMYRVPTGGGQSWRITEAAGSNPKLSPDGKSIVFTRGVSKWWRTGYRGSANWDLWLFEPGTNEFRQLTDFDGSDFYPVWDTRGNGVYYLSDREDTHNVWFQALRGAPPRKITSVTGERVRDFTVSANGRRLMYTQWDKIFTQTLPGGKVQEVVITAASDSARNETQLKTLTGGASEIEASPDGNEIAVVVHGEIYVIKAEADKPTRRVTNSPARDWQVTWSPDGDALYFISDRDGQEDVYRATSGDEPAVAFSDSLRFVVERVTETDETESSPQISPDGEKLSFVRGLGNVYIRDLESGDERLLIEGWNTPAVRWSADSKWIAYSIEDEEYNSDVWVVPADGSATAANISQHPDYDGNPRWSADGQVLAFASRRAGIDTDLYMVFLSEELGEKSSVDLAEYFEQAGKAAGKRKPPKDVRASGEIVLGTPVETDTQPTTDLTEDGMGEAEGEEEPEPKPEETSIEDRLRVLLKEFIDGPKEDKKKKDDDEDDEAEPAPEYQYDLDSAYKRIRRVTRLPVDQTSFALAPAGNLLVFNSSHEGSSRLFSVKWNGRDRKRIMSSSAGALKWTLNGKRLFYSKSGKPGSCTSSGGDVKTHEFRAKMAILHREEARQKFDDAARALERQFYHPTLKDLDWPALAEKHRELALRTHTYEEFNTIFNLLQGHLNGSHLGIFGPDSRSVERIGYLGCEFDPEHAGPGLKIAAITPQTPADRDESRLRIGDVLLQVNGQPVGPEAALEPALIDTVGEQIIVEYLPSPERAGEVENEEEAAGDVEEDVKDADADEEGEEDKANELIIRPISYRSFAQLRYDEWVERNRKYVEEQSGGRLAYAHIAGMGESQFHVFERDLYAAAHGKEGLIIDVRNNGGGWTADWVMAVLNVQRHAYTVGRGGKPGYPQGRLIFYAWTKPATMMCNECSYSNAEIISHAFKNLGRGPLVGTTTFGAVISTGGYGLIDGTRIRMPFRGWYTLPHDVDMENNGAVPDVEVALTPAAEARGLYPQLDSAIKATLAQLDVETTSKGSMERKEADEEVPTP